MIKKAPGRNKYFENKTPAGLLWKIGGTTSAFFLQDLCNNFDQGAIMWKGN